MLLVLKQPDWERLLTYIPIAIMGVFLGGMQWKQGLLVAVLAGIGVGAVFFVPRVHVLKTYQKQRLTSFLEPDADPQGSGYQVEQSLIAVGSGGVMGGKGSQTTWGFPASSPTDFTFRGHFPRSMDCGRAGVSTAILHCADALTQNAQNSARPRWHGSW